jgi:competence CoiA-like predicted nuclease
MNYLNKHKESIKWKDYIKRINQKEGWCKIFSNNSLKHEMVKFAIMHKLKGMGYEVWSEVELTNGFSGRPDIYAVKGEHCFIIEVLNSETEKDCIKNKADKYPIKPIMVKTKDFDFEDIKL